MCTSKRVAFATLLLYLCHYVVAINTHYIHLFGCSDGVSATRTLILTCMAWFSRCSRCRCSRLIVRAYSCRYVLPFDAVHLYVTPSLLNDELQKAVGRLRYAPSDCAVITDYQVSFFGSLFESLVVISTASGTVFYSRLQVPQVDHLV